MTVRICVTFPGDARDLSTFGGSPFHIVEALRGAGVDAFGLDLTYPGNLANARLIWNLKELASLRGLGGYQYSKEFLSKIWRNVDRRSEKMIYINMFQLYDFATFDVLKGAKTFYIDQTLRQLFANYNKSPFYSDLHKESAVAAEGHQYRNCELVICKSEWAAASLLDEYNVPKEKVAIVLPGANVNFQAASRLLDRLPQGREPRAGAKLRCLFIGKEPVRKGLFRFLDALKFIPNASDRLSVTVIGPNLSDIPGKYLKMPNVDWIGPIRKSAELERFIKTVVDHDLGILVSTAEAGGLSLREFQLFGLGVLAPNVGGAPEMIAEGAGRLIDPADGPEKIASIVSSLLENPEIVSDMRKSALKSRDLMTVDHSAKLIVNAFQERGLI